MIKIIDYRFKEEKYDILFCFLKTITTFAQETKKFNNDNRIAKQPNY